MSIYSRDNIAHQTMIDNAINNRLKTMYRKSDRIQKDADIASNLATGLASTFGRAMDYAQYASEQKALEKKLAELEAKRDQLVRKESAYEQDKFNPTSFDYQSRNDTTDTPDRSYNISTDWMVHANPDNYYKLEDNPEYNNNFSVMEQWLEANPGKTEEDYNAYINYMNSIYGGR